MKLNKKIIRVTAELKKFHPDKLILFGSYAKNGQNKNSDIDILFIKAKFLQKRMVDRIRSIYTSLPITGVDIIPYTPMEIKHRIKFNDFFLKDALTEGIVLYEKKTG